MPRFGRGRGVDGDTPHPKTALSLPTEQPAEARHGGRLLLSELQLRCSNIRFVGHSSSSVVNTFHAEHGPDTAAGPIPPNTDRYYLLRPWRGLFLSFHSRLDLLAGKPWCSFPAPRDFIFLTQGRRQSVCKVGETLHSNQRAPEWFTQLVQSSTNQSLGRKQTCTADMLAAPSTIDEALISRPAPGGNHGGSLP